MKTAILIILFYAFLTFQTSAGATAKIDFFVAPGGSDASAGTLEKPFATLERARDAIRTLKRSGDLTIGGVTVEIRAGTYELTKTFVLTQEDSGTEQAPIVYRRYKDEEVRLVGGQQISGFKPVKDPRILRRLDESVRYKVLQTDLRLHGITDFGELTPRGYDRPMQPVALELFFQARPMTLARWPNQDWARIVDTPAGKDGGRFTYEGDRPRRWLNTDDAWLHGYWSKDYHDSFVKVRSINVQARVIATEKPHGVDGYTAGQRYYALNLLEELDEPGEWYLDRTSGILYFWPPVPLDQGMVNVSMLPTIVSLQNVSYLSLRGVTIEMCRGTAVEMNGGSHNRIAGCIVRNTGNNGVRINNGVDNGVLSCDIYGTGEGGIIIDGGDRRTLIPGENFADNNHIHHINRWCRTYRPAIWLTGVGNRAAHNFIHDSPHTGILFTGNDHLIEFNEIYKIAYETDDVGAVYTLFQDWTNRGTVIRYNFFHDLLGSLKKQGAIGVIAVYLDNASSGTLVYGNVVYKADYGVLIGGGRDNTVENNIFVECSKAVSIDGRGLVSILSDKFVLNADFAPGGKMGLYEKLKAVNHDKPPYSVRYPRLAGILADDPQLPKGNLVARNIADDGKWLKLDYISGLLVKVEDNIVADEKLFIDPSRMNFQLKDDALPYKNGFQKIPFESIGLYVDEYRPFLPEVSRK